MARPGAGGRLQSEGRRSLGLLRGGGHHDDGGRTVVIVERLSCEREKVFLVLLDGADEDCHVVVLGGTVCEFVGSGEDAIQ